MMKPLARTEEQTRYWVSHLRAGALLNLGVAALCLIYVHVTGPLHGSRVPLTAVVVAGAVPGILVLASATERLVRRSRGTLVLYAWNAVAVLFIALGGALDGGWRSPLLFLLVLPPVRASVAYPVGGVVACGGLAVLAELTVVGLTGAPAGRLVLGVVTLVAVTWACAAAARNAERRRRREEFLGRRLRHLADHDSLTGLLARRAFLQRLSEQRVQALRDGTGLCLLLLDIDHFKGVNDEHGHPAGDEVLREVGALLGEAGRRVDVAGRLGGDELALVLPGADLDAARRVAEALVEEVKGLDLPASVTVSVGVGELRDEQSVAELVADVDASLYDAKESGRDRVGQTGQRS